MLLIRAVCGVAALIQGVYYVAASHPDAAASFMALVDFGGGGLLLAGFLTPIAALVVGAGLLAAALSVLSAPAPNLCEARPALVFALTMLLSLTGLGPGAFSVDARLFGRREIIIPTRINDDDTTFSTEDHGRIS